MPSTSAARASLSVNPFLRIASYILKSANVLICVILLCLIVECVGISFFWDVEDGTRVQRRIDTETQIAIRSWSPSYYQSALLKYSGAWVRFCSRSLLPLDTWVRKRTKEQSSRTNSLHGFAKEIHAFHAATFPYVSAAIDALKGASFRLAVLFAGIPTAFLFVVVGVTDGLARREVRRLSGGRESSWLYDYSRRLAIPLITSCCGLYVVWPGVLHPSWGIVSVSLFGGVVATLTVSRFKKYL